MKLLSMSYPVAKELFDHLGIQETFFLSLCSTNTKNFIKRTQKYQLEKIKRVDYKMEDKPTVEMEMFPGGRFTRLMSFYISTHDLREKVSWFKESEPIEVVRVNVLGMPIECFRSSPRRSYLFGKYCHCNAESLFEAIHKHLCDLLGHHTKFWLHSTSTADSAHSNFIPMLRNLQGMHLWGKLDTGRIDKVLATSHSLELVSWYTAQNKSVRFERNSRIYNMDTVYVSPSRSLTSDVIKYFNGRHAFLDSANIPATEVIRLLNEWKSGEKFGNLEVISLKKCSNIPKILGSVEFKKLHLEVTYYFNRKHESTFRFREDPSEFKTDLYIVRQTDGRVASVRLDPENVFMGVWNMTEYEFLQKLYGWIQ